MYEIRTTQEFDDWLDNLKIELQF